MFVFQIDPLPCRSSRTSPRHADMHPSLSRNWRTVTPVTDKVVLNLMTSNYCWRHKTWRHAIWSNERVTSGASPWTTRVQEIIREWHLPFALCRKNIVQRCYLTTHLLCSSRNKWDRLLFSCRLSRFDSAPSARRRQATFEHQQRDCARVDDEGRQVPVHAVRAARHRRAAAARCKQQAWFSTIF